ncbi:hypothetical protein BCAMP_05661 [Brochothrix campestris FSL F6-1037]|uniref:Uncharacterized protein n=2 Tax=Brochothrix campestris TaxID=2757 RepID=W7CTB5_9LIST|nr:hypothetical protein BCAMP_05661 [Brochothrix campestris FSL F6-1037]
MIDLIVLIFVMLITSFGIYFSTLPFVPDIMINALWAFFILYLIVRMVWGKFSRNREVTVVLFTLAWVIITYVIAYFI